MKTLIISFMSVLLGFAANAQDTKYYELRTYYTFEGKRPDLVKRFQDHTLKLFKKSGMENIAYFIPVDESNQTLIYFLAYPDKPSRDKSWNTFMNDPDWKEVQKKSEENGKIVSKVDNAFMTKAPELNSKKLKQLTKGDKIFELRTYYCYPGKLGDLNARFRDHTQKLFEKHGITNVAYWFTEEKEGDPSHLVYLIAHKNQEAAKASWDAFRADPEWIKAKDASEANGKIVEKVESIYLKALPFSPMK